MNMPQIGKALAVAAVATFAASNAFAATQGTLGATSTGSLNITLTIDQLVQISASMTSPSAITPAATT